MIAQHYERNFYMSFLQQLSSLSRDGSTLGGLADAAEKIGLSTLAINTTYKDMAGQLPLHDSPALRKEFLYVLFTAIIEPFARWFYVRWIGGCRREDWT